MDRTKLQKYTINDRNELNSKLYLGEIMEIDKPEFGSNNLIIAPVGSGKSHLIEQVLIPKGFKGKALYLTSNSALKDSICPDKNELRSKLEKEGKSLGFFTTSNKERIGTSGRNVHVMTYHEFGNKIESPNQVFTNDISLIFCDEIHSLPIYKTYDNSPELDRAMRWLFTKHEYKQLFYFTATQDKLVHLDKSVPGYLSAVSTYDYSNHSRIRKYVANSTYLISHIEQLRPHLQAKLEAFNYYGYKGLAFTKYIREQEKIYEIAKSEGFEPIALWSVNHEEKKMSDEQLRVRDFVLSSGYIPEPYNLLIINGAMQEGWNLEDNMMRLAILDTLDLTEQIQALGRIRQDIDLVIRKTDDDSLVTKVIDIPKKYLNIRLTNEDKVSLYMELNIINQYGKISKWPTIKKLIEEAGHTISEEQIVMDGKRIRVSTINTPSKLS